VSDSTAPAPEQPIDDCFQELIVETGVVLLDASAGTVLLMRLV
jgi:hypothetical protein